MSSSALRGVSSATASPATATLTRARTNRRSSAWSSGASSEGEVTRALRVVTDENGIQRFASADAPAVGRDDEQGIRIRHRREDAGTLRARQARRGATVAHRNDGAKEVRKRGVDRDWFVEHHRHRTPEKLRVTSHLLDRWPREQLEGHHRRDGVSRQADPWLAAEQAEGEPRAGAHAHAPELHLSAH